MEFSFMRAGFNLYREQLFIGVLPLLEVGSTTAWRDALVWGGTTVDVGQEKVTCDWEFRTGECAAGGRPAARAGL